jgi:hypothetical protein
MSWMNNQKVVCIGEHAQRQPLMVDAIAPEIWVVALDNHFKEDNVDLVECHKNGNCTISG